MTQPKSDMREALLASARTTVQAHGYNALSFRELAKEVGIKSASVHYHFPTKGDLGAALARRYTQDGAAYLAEIASQSKNPRWSRIGTSSFFVFSSTEIACVSAAS